jgi:hypothetical protein
VCHFFRSGLEEHVPDLENSQDQELEVIQSDHVVDLVPDVEVLVDPDHDPFLGRVLDQDHVRISVDQDRRLQAAFRDRIHDQSLGRVIEVTRETVTA